jgi:SEC-C motif/DegT/DnrJ/EryC1/StrS aminotransferase family
MTPQQSAEQILALVGEYAAARHAPRPFDPSSPRVPASGRVFGPEEVVELVRTSLDFWLTAGPEAAVFERSLARRTGQRHALLVNSGSDHIHHYEHAEFANTLWVKAWKHPAAGVPVQIARTGGHAAEFAGRRVCPVHFISLHYPIRTPEHAKRKIFAERLDRYPAEEREMGWHNHWDDLAASATDFLWDAADLIRYDQTEVQARVLAQGSVDMMLATCIHGIDLAAAPDFNARFAAWFGHAAGAGGPLTVAGMELAHGAMQEIARHAITGNAMIASDPLVTRAALALLEASIAHARGQGEFHHATLFSQARDAALPLARDQHRQTTAPPPAAEPEAARNAPCPCGSGLKFKRCHGLQAAA